MMVDAEGTATRTVPAPVHGVSLDRYAGVIAGLSDGLPIAEVLDNEGVDPSTWPEAEELWQERLIDDEGGDLQARFDALLADAQDRYGRAIAPLDDEVSAWLDFVRAFASADAPLAFVAALGLRGTDVLRLHRRWARRMADDPQIASAAQAALEREPGALPPLVVGERSIRPPHDAPARLAVHATPVEDTAPHDAASEPDDAPASSPPVPPFFASLGLDEVAPGATIDEPRATIDEPRATIDEPRVTIDEPRVSTPVRSAPPITPAAAPEPPPPPLAGPVTRTQAPPPFAAAVAPPLPFAERASASETARHAAPIPTAPPRPFDSTISHEGLPPELLRRIADAQLPFARSSTVSPPPSDEEPSTLAPQPSPFKKAALPFAPSASEPARPAAPRTTDSALPFRPAPPAAPAVTAPPVAAPPVAAPPVAAPPVAARPVAPGPPPTAPLAPMAPLPTLTLDQYASMCAELAVFSDRQQAIFAKYGLADAPRRAAFDAAWKERLKRYPSERAEWDRRYWQYEASWRRTRR